MSDNIASPRRSTTITEARLITSQELAERLTEPNDELRLIHIAAASAFEQSHLPEALLVEPRDLVTGTPPAVGRLPDIGRLNELFGRLGYTGNAEFVLYDDEGGGWAGRFAWTLDVIGHRSWSYLDGGIQAWTQSGGVLDNGSCRYPAASIVSLSIDTTPIAEIEDLLAAIEDDNQIIWDVRSREEYLGLKKNAARAGHIPTACHLDWMDLKDPRGSTRLKTNLLELLTDHGIDPLCPVITHCQTHHRSGLSYMVCRLLGFADIRAYHGSWSEWGNREDTPVEQGP